MPRPKTGRPLGRPVVYTTEEEKPVTRSLRIPRDLDARLERYASLHRQSVTELLLDGLKWRIGEGEYYGNTETSTEVLVETDHTAVLAEIRTTLLRQETQLCALAQALEQRPVASPPETYYGNTTKETSEPQGSPEPKRDDSNTVLQKDGGVTAPGEAARPAPPTPEMSHDNNTVIQQPAVSPVVPDEADGSAPRPAPDKAAIVAMLQAMRDEGLSLREMAAQLQAEGVPTLSGKGRWGKGTIHGLLHSPA